MKKKILIAFIVVGLILMGIRVHATTYYFDATLGVAAPGRSLATASNISTPLKSIADLNFYFSALQPGDFALFKRGETFYGSVNANKSGTNADRITIGAYGSGDDPIFTTLVNVTNWTNISGNIYESISAVSTLSTLRICVDDGVLLHTARYPNSTYLTVDARSWSLPTSTSTISDAGFSSSLWSTFTDLDNGYLVARDIQWALEKVPINSHSAYGAGTTFTLSAGLNYNTPVGWGYFVQDFATALDAVGEFYYNPTTKKLRVYSVGTPTNVKISNIETLVSGAARSYITFDNINFQGANSYIFNMTGTGLTVQNSEVSFSGIEGIKISGSSTVIEACYVHDIMDQGINTGSASVRNTQVINTAHIPGMNQNGAGKAAIANSGTGSINEYNVVRNTGYIGIRIGRTNALTKNNVLDNFCMNRNDGGALYVQGETSTSNTYTNSAVTGNIIMNGSTASSVGVGSGSNNSVYGIYGDDKMSGLVVTGNTVFNMPRAGYFFHGNKNITLTGNTGFNCGESQFFLSPSGIGWVATGFIVSSNIFIAKTTSQKVVYFNISSSENIAAIGTINNNYYSRPVLETVAGGWGAAGNIIQTSVSFGNYQYYNLDRWNSTFVHDAATTNFGTAIPNTPAGLNLLTIIWNETKVPETKTLPNIYKDVTGANYSVSTVLQPFTSLVLLQTGIGTGKTDPVITWANPSAITYGTLLSATQLNATSGGVPGTFSYTPALNTLLNAGTHSLRVDFVPTDQAAYNSVSKTVTIVVNKATATLAYTSDLTTKVYNGLPQAPTVVTTPAGLGTVTTLYNGVGTTPTGAGSYPVSSGLNHINYTASTISGTFIINKAAASFNISNLAQVYNTLPKPITVTTNPTGLIGVVVTYDLSTTPKTNAGSYAVAVTLTHTNYIATTVNTTLVISKATPTVSWSTPAAITYGTALSGTQLNATASVAGTFIYSPVSGTVLNASATPQSLSVNFTPTDAANYNSVNGTTTTILVNKAVATINLGGLAQVADGSPKSVTVSTTPVGLGVLTVTYAGSTNPPSAPGTYPIIVQLTNSNWSATNATGDLVISTSAASVTITNLFQTYDGTPKPVTVTVSGGWPYDITYSDDPNPPTDADSYTVVATINDGIHFGSATETLEIAKADPVITWPNPVAITFGTALSGTQLNATSPVAGVKTYLPAAGYIPNVGVLNLSVELVPTDGANYNTVTKIVSITVNKQTATIVISNLDQTHDGSIKPITVTSNPATLSGIIITYNGSEVVPSGAGTYAIVVQLVNDNWQATNVNGILVIGKGTPVLTWAQPERIFAGTPLTSVQLNATANMAGVFSYPLNPIGTILPVGTRSISATFSPTDSANYNTITISVPISVHGSNLDYINGNWIFLNL